MDIIPSLADPAFADCLLGIDIETGGFDPKKHALVEFGWVVLDRSFQTKAGGSFYIHPSEGRIVEPTAADINGYDPQLWLDRNAVDLATARSQILQLLSRRVPMTWIHNASFEKRFLSYYMPEVLELLGELRCSQKWLRAWHKANGLDPRQKGSLTLENGCKIANYSNSGAHGGFEDCYRMAALLRHLHASGVPYPAEEAEAA